MKMPLRPGALPPQHVVVPTGEPLRESGPLKDLCLELREGEAVSYTIRDVKEKMPGIRDSESHERKGFRYCDLYQ